MIKKITLSILGILLFSFISNAASPVGGQVTYRYLSSNKFEVTYKIYRDCRGTGLSTVSYSIRCAGSGSTKTLSATRVNIVDINPSCPSRGVICNPSNQTISGSDPGFEEHTYMDTLDFNGSESAFKSCCIIQIGTGGCCRNGAITTGAAGQDFWVYSTLDLCNAPTNSSPVFAFKPNFTATTNELFMQSYLAKDSIDKDSLSYNFTDPLTSWTGKVNWGGGFDSKNSFSAFYPINYNKANGPNPNANPPIGIYLDPSSGNLVASATSSSEISIMAIAVKEWRKNGSGKYIQIGEIVIDQPILLINYTNHTPAIITKFRYNVCEGEKFSLDIPTDDQPYTQALPNPTIYNDTVTLSWNKGVKNASYSIYNSAVKLPVGKFEWTPATGDSKKSPFIFSAIAIDNNCPLRGSAVKNIQLYVYPKISLSTSVKKINNSTYAASINIGNKSYFYVAGKFITSQSSPDIRSYYFKSSKDIYSSSETDTIVFKRNGTYYINQTFLSETECNSKTLIDTIVVTNVMEVSMGMTPLGDFSDTSVCKNQIARTFAKVTNAKRPVTYTWKIGKTTKTDTLGFFDLAYTVTDTLFLNIKDANGQTNSTFRTVNVKEVPSISAGMDVIICPEGKIKLTAQNKNTAAVNWTWIKAGKTLSTADTVMATASGDYIAQGTNLGGCSAYDTLKVNHYNTIKINLISGVYCQSKDHLDQSEIIKGKVNPNFRAISWKLLKTLPKVTNGDNNISDLLSDKNPNPDFDFTININESRIIWPDTYRDSLIFSAVARDTNGCFSNDTMTVSVIKMPQVSTSNKLIENCINKSFNLDSFGTSGSNFKWVPFNLTGYATWPSLTPFTNGMMVANKFVQGGKYIVKLEANNDFCIKSDTLEFTIFPRPRPIIGITKLINSIKFRDETINELSHKWYINGVFFTNDDTMLLSKSFIHLQPIKLEVIDNSGCTNDTTIIINTQIGINEIARSGIEVYPNPAKNQLVLKQLDTWVPSQFEIYDVLGKKVITGTTKNREELIDIKGINSGIYYLKYKNEDGVISIPFIKSE